MWTKIFGRYIIALSLALLTACMAKHEDEAREWLSIQVQAYTPETKTTLSDDGSETTFLFSTGDKLGFFADGVLNNQPLNCTNGASGDFSGKILLSGSQTATLPSLDYYAYYPYVNPHCS